MDEERFIEKGSLIESSAGFPVRTLGLVGLRYTEGDNEPHQTRIRVLRLRLEVHFRIMNGNQQVSVTNPLRQIYADTYDPAGNRLNVTDRSGRHQLYL